VRTASSATAAPSGPPSARRRPAVARVLRAAALAAALLAAPREARAEPAIPALVDSFAAATIEDRRWLHAHPELSLREHATQAYVREKLGSIPGIEIIPGEWGTGLVALLRGGAGEGPVIGYRADIDALPITEATGLPFASTARDTLGGRDVGVMHACGHDLHAAILLGTARVLSAARDRFGGTVLFVVEPAEEIGAGASLLLEAGVFEDGRKPEAIFALHDHPTILLGQAGYCPGRSAANVDEFRVRVIGKGGHGAYPHRAIDPVVIASEMILALQKIVSREVDAARQAVITVGSIHGGSATNVIPESVELRGTVRTLEPEVRRQVQDAVLRTIKGIAQAAGAPAPEIEYVLGTPSCFNDPVLVESILPVLRDVLGEENVLRYEPAMGGEDFSFFQEAVPGVIFRLGVGRPEREMSTHSPAFDPDERAIPIGMRLMSEILLARLTLSQD